MQPRRPQGRRVKKSPRLKKAAPKRPSRAKKSPAEEAATEASLRAKKKEGGVLDGPESSPVRIRLGIHTDWKSRWFNEKQYRDYLVADLRIREYLLGQLPHAGISRIEIERTGSECASILSTARPGIVIGRRGSEAERLRSHLEQMESDLR